MTHQPESTDATVLLATSGTGPRASFVSTETRASSTLVTTGDGDGGGGV